MRGENPAYVKEQLGHSSITVTIDLYEHLFQGCTVGRSMPLPKPQTQPPCNQQGRLVQSEMEGIQNPT